MKFKIFITFLTITVGFILFYWLQVRPGEIRKNCEAYAGSKENTNYNRGKIRANNLYRQCLIKNGIQAESIYVNVE